MLRQPRHFKGCPAFRQRIMERRTWGLALQLVKFAERAGDFDVAPCPSPSQLSIYLAINRLYRRFTSCVRRSAACAPESADRLDHNSSHTRVLLRWRASSLASGFACGRERQNDLPAGSPRSRKPSQHLDRESQLDYHRSFVRD